MNFICKIPYLGIWSTSDPNLWVSKDVFGYRCCVAAIYTAFASKMLQVRSSWSRFGFPKRAFLIYCSRPPFPGSSSPFLQHRRKEAALRCIYLLRTLFFFHPPSSPPSSPSPSPSFSLLPRHLNFPRFLSNGSTSQGRIKKNRQLHPSPTSVPTTISRWVAGESTSLKVTTISTKLPTFQRMPVSNSTTMSLIRMMRRNPSVARVLKSLVDISTVVS